MAIGVLLVILALFMTPPLVADLVSGHGDWQVFLLSAGATAFTGVALVLMNQGRGSIELNTRQGFMLTALAWLVTSIFAALPLALSELNLSTAGAFFEAMSGLTTTGSTVIEGLDNAPPGILLWRGILQWLGGIGIIVMGVAILPILSVGGMQLVRTESSDLSDKILPRAAQIASAIGVIYLAFTVACGSLYWMAGMTVFEATVHAMTTIATGGFSTSDASIGVFDSAAIEWIAISFMIVGGVPFVLYIQATQGDMRPLSRDVQVRWFLSIILLATLGLAAWILWTGQPASHGTIRVPHITTDTVITGTGYVSTVFGIWGSFPVALLFFLLCVGGCTGSTTGGIKVFRFNVLYEVASVQVHRLLQPNGVFRAFYNNRPIADTAAISVMAFFFVFSLSFAVLVLLLSFMGIDYLTAMSAAITSLANVGPGLGEIVGPAQNFAELPEGAKWVLAFGMLLGRLELFTVLVLLTPAFWRA
ncbi:MAG: TrkH family potassium uptake protein [Pseudomonadota bacterium]